MTGNGEHTTVEHLKLRSRISELAQVPHWIERLASRYSIPDSTLYAMNLCLEEVLSNIIQYGYSGKTENPISIHFNSPREKYFVLVVEDEAPHFNPVDSPELPALNSLDENSIGGQGIRLLRRFADALEYQATPVGNRLTIGFSAEHSALARD